MRDEECLDILLEEAAERRGGWVWRCKAQGIIRGNWDKVPIRIVDAVEREEDAWVVECRGPYKFVVGHTNGIVHVYDIRRGRPRTYPPDEIDKMLEYVERLAATYSPTGAGM